MKLSKAAPNPTVAPAGPSLTALQPTAGRAGDVIAIDGLNLGPAPDDNRVLFRSTSTPEVALPGQVLSVQRLGVGPQGAAMRRLQVVVPTGVRNSAVEVLVRGGPDLISAGTLPFAANPIILGAIHGNDNEGFVYLDPVMGLLPATVVLYGHNLGTATQVRFFDELQQELVAPAFVPGLPPAANYEFPDGLESLVVTLPTTGYAFFDCFDAARLAVSVTNPAGDSNEIELRVRKVAGTPGDFPASFSGLLLPSGVRSGDVEIAFNLVAAPASERWSVIPEFEDPSTGLFLPCTAQGDPSGVNLVAGLPLMASMHPALIGPGQSHRFVWNSVADLPGQAVSTRIRLHAVPENPATTLFECETTTWESEWIAVDNTGTGPIAMSESFETREFLDAALTDADWDTTTGVLRGTGVDVVEMFGLGTDDVIFSTGRDYEIHTDTGVVFDVTDPMSPRIVPINNPGASFGEFHFRTWVVETGAHVTATGVAPLVVRCSGVGQPLVEVAIVDGEVDLSGRAGGNATVSSSGVGGAGGAGGSPGGRGGFIATFLQRVTAFTHAQPGTGLGGGGAGLGLTHTAAVGSSSVRPGPGGGAGHAGRGSDGRISAAFQNPRGEPGAGGPPHGDSAVTELRGGSGGGGGGASAFRVNGTQPLLPRFGGGGGGGGGGFEVIARGSIRVAGEIHCDGGAGGAGSTNTSGGGGGGGSGGTIALRASDRLIVGSASQVTARGGLGGGPQGAAYDDYRGGHGAPGRVRLEGGVGVGMPGDLNLPGLMESSVFPPNVVTRTLAAPLPPGSGGDGVLDLSGETGVFTIDTATGVITSPLGSSILTAMSGSGSFDFAGLQVPEAVVLRGIGVNPLVIHVAGDALIAGTIDVSGQDGAPPDYSNALAPMPGGGGAPGPAGGAGGAGGIAQGPFQVDGERGHLPPGLPASAMDVPSVGTPSTQPLPLFTTSAAEGGQSAQATVPDSRAGAGGGGGHAREGGAGQPTLAGPSGVAPGGRGGTRYGNMSFVDAAGAPARFGGSGGGGGGASPQASGGLSSSPGGGGGGGGGYLEVVVAGSFRLTESARLLANGGASFRVADGGGSGGPGSGGSIVLRASGSFFMDAPGPVISALPGIANQAFPLPPSVSPSLTAAGAGSPGRILLESFGGFPLPFDQTVIEPAPSVGVFRAAEAPVSEGVTLPYELTLAGARRLSPVDAGVVITSAPPSSFSLPTYRWLFSGARESRSLPGAVGPFTGWTDSLDAVRGQEFVRLRLVLFGTPMGLAQVEVDEVGFLIGQ